MFVSTNDQMSTPQSKVYEAKSLKELVQGGASAYVIEQLVFLTGFSPREEMGESCRLGNQERQ